MYDRDLRAWYRDLFLHRSRRQTIHRGAAIDLTAPVWEEVPGCDGTLAGIEMQRSRHERPHATG